MSRAFGDVCKLRFPQSHVVGSRAASFVQGGLGADCVPVELRVCSSVNPEKHRAELH